MKITMNSKPKVLHYLYRDDFGGGPKTLWTVSRYLSDLASTYIIYKGSGNLARLTNENETSKIYKTPNLPDFLFFLDAYFLYRAINKVKPDILFVYGQRGGVTSAIASFFSNHVTRVYICTFVSLYESSNLFLLLRNYVAEKLTLSRHKKIVFTSEGNIRYFTHLGLISDRFKIHLIPNEIEPSSSLQVKNLDSLVWKNNKSIKFLYLGRLVPGKKVDWLLKAWRFAIDAGLENSELSVVGSGPDLLALQDLASKLSIQDTVQFVSHVEDPRWLLASCDVLAFPSQYEGHALVPIEALAAGKPLITMDADGVRESFTDAVEGFCCPLGDWKYFGQKIALLAQDHQLRRQMGENAHRRATYSSQGASRSKYRKLFTEIIGKLRMHP